MWGWDQPAGDRQVSGKIAVGIPQPARRVPSDQSHLAGLTGWGTPPGEHVHGRDGVLPRERADSMIFVGTDR